MNERIKELAKEHGFVRWDYDSLSYELKGDIEDLYAFAELIVQECTQLLFAESERLYTYSSECDNMRHSDEAELCAEKCMDNIQMIEEHFGVEE